MVSRGRWLRRRRLPMGSNRVRQAPPHVVFGRVRRDLPPTKSEVSSHVPACERNRHPRNSRPDPDLRVGGSRCGGDGDPHADHRADEQGLDCELCAADHDPAGRPGAAGGRAPAGRGRTGHLHVFAVQRGRLHPGRFGHDRCERTLRGDLRPSGRRGLLRELRGRHHLLQFEHADDDRERIYDGQPGLPGPATGRGPGGHLGHLHR